MINIRCGILTVSDRSFTGIRPDQSGPELVKAAQQAGWQVVTTAIVPDEIDEIRKVIVGWSDSGEIDLILTTGGTGFAPRDVTPEATAQIIHRSAPGISEAMRIDSARKTPHAWLSRGIAGIRGRALIINLPGSPKAAVENLSVVLPVIPHAIELLQDAPSAEQGHKAY